MAFLVVLLLHIVLAGVVVRMFAPRLEASTVAGVRDAITVTFTLEPPKPPQPAPDSVMANAPAKPVPVARNQGASAPAGKTVEAIERAAPVARVPIETIVAAPVEGRGEKTSAGAAPAGTGRAAGGDGTGTGAGRRGTGSGGGGQARPTLKIAGDINSARDYPRRSRDLRIGHSVVIDLQVGVDGRVRSCRIQRPSPDAQADQITCELATRRFRFRPATNAQGEPIEALYRWQQRWFVN